MPGGSGGDQKQETKVEPWSGQQPYLLRGFSEANRLYDEAVPTFYPENTVAGFQPEQNIALDLTAQRALAGSPLIGAAQGYAGAGLGGEYLGGAPNTGFLTRAMTGQHTGDAANLLRGTATGGFLGANPTLDATYNRAADRMTDAYRQSVLPGITSQFATHRALGSGAQARQQRMAQEALGEGLSDLAANVYGQDYARERGLMQQAQMGLGGLQSTNLRDRMGAAGLLGQQYGQERGMQQQLASMAPGLAAQDYVDMSTLAGVGQARQGQQQAEINADIARYNYGQMQPWEQLARYMGNIQGNYGSTTTSRLDQPSNVLGMGLGAGLIGLGAYQSGLFKNVGNWFGGGTPSFGTWGSGTVGPSMNDISSFIPLNW